MSRVVAYFILVACGGAPTQTHPLHSTSSDRLVSIQPEQLPKIEEIVAAVKIYGHEHAHGTFTQWETNGSRRVVVGEGRFLMNDKGCIRMEYLDLLPVTDMTGLTKTIVFDLPNVTEIDHLKRTFVAQNISSVPLVYVPMYIDKLTSQRVTVARVDSRIELRIPLTSKQTVRILVGEQSLRVSELIVEDDTKDVGIRLDYEQISRSKSSWFQVTPAGLSGYTNGVSQSSTVPVLDI